MTFYLQSLGLWPATGSTDIIMIVPIQLPWPFMSESIHPSAWRDFLVSNGATFEDDRVQHFGNPVAERAAADGDVLVDLSHLALWRVQGEDAENFLQGQLSNDIRTVDEGHAQLSAYCNPKGRMFAIFQIMRRGDAYYLQLPAALAEATFKRLRMFVLRAKVKIESADLELARIGLSGPNAESLVTEIAGASPAAPYDAIQTNGISAIRLPGAHPRFELLAPSPRMPALWKAFAQHAKPVGAGIWSWLDIQAGIPVVLPGTVEEFVPQMANLELVGGVSFTKGCYPGQEIVARMHYLGRLKQRMFLARLSEATTLPSPGTAVYSPNLPGQSTGAVIDAQWSPRGGVDLLVVVHLDSKRANDLHLHDFSGPRLELSALPYAVPDVVS